MQLSFMDLSEQDHTINVFSPVFKCVRIYYNTKLSPQIQLSIGIHDSVILLSLLAKFYLTAKSSQCVPPPLQSSSAFMYFLWGLYFATMVSVITFTPVLARYIYQHL